MYNTKNYFSLLKRRKEKRWMYKWWENSMYVHTNIIKTKVKWNISFYIHNMCFKNILLLVT